MSKQNFNEKLIALLKIHSEFTDESGELLTAAVKTTHGNLTTTLSNYCSPKQEQFSDWNDLILG